MRLRTILIPQGTSLQQPEPDRRPSHLHPFFSEPAEHLFGMMTAKGQVQQGTLDLERRKAQSQDINRPPGVRQGDAEHCRFKNLGPFGHAERRFPEDQHRTRGSRAEGARGALGIGRRCYDPRGPLEQSAQARADQSNSPAHPGQAFKKGGQSGGSAVGVNDQVKGMAFSPPQLPRWIRRQDFKTGREPLQSIHWVP